MELRATLCVLAAAAVLGAALPADSVAMQEQPAPVMDATPAESMMTLAMPDAAEREGPTEAMAADNVEEQAGRAYYPSEPTAADVARGVYAECLAYGSFACVKPRVLAFLGAAAHRDVIPITRDLVIERTGRDFPQVESNEAAGAGAGVVERVDAFLHSHALRVRLPRELREGPLAALVPSALLSGLPSELRVPLADGASHAGQERGLMKKIVMPFLLGLKFKATALVPLALALIALKTWKALTLGLLSLVLSGALVIFKFTKPKVVNYEVIHYPHAAAPAVVEHPVAMPYDHHGYEHHGYGRALPDAQQQAYAAYAQQ